MRVVVSPDKFKGCLTAAEVAAAVAAGIGDEIAGADITLLPVADGGDGTVAAAVAAGFRRVEVAAVGPTGEAVVTSYATRGEQAVVELADVVGLDRLPGGRLDPLRSSTYGLGLVIADAIDQGARRVVIGVGGSASTDGGAGLVQALGAIILDRSGGALPRGGAGLADVGSLDLTSLHRRVSGVSFTVASDVDNPLLGPRGAAAVFGPQKGAGPEQVAVLEAGLERWAAVVADLTGHDLSARHGSGAAGGTAFAAIALLDADLVAGIALMLDLIEFRAAAAGADLVITGEGSLDDQSLAGKAPVGVAEAARELGIPVVAVAGRSLLGDDRLVQAGISRAYPLSELEPDIGRSIAEAPSLLRAVGRRIAVEWLS